MYATVNMSLVHVPYQDSGGAVVRGRLAVLYTITPVLHGAAVMRHCVAVLYTFLYSCRLTMSFCRTVLCKCN